MGGTHTGPTKSWTTVMGATATQRTLRGTHTCVRARPQRTGSTEPGSNKSVGVKTKRSMWHSPHRLGVMLVLLLAMIQLASAQTIDEFLKQLNAVKTLDGLEAVYVKISAATRRLERQSSEKSTRSRSLTILSKQLAYQSKLPGQSKQLSQKLAGQSITKANTAKKLAGQSITEANKALSLNMYFDPLHKKFQGKIEKAIRAKDRKERADKEKARKEKEKAEREKEKKGRSSTGASSRRR